MEQILSRYPSLPAASPGDRHLLTECHSIWGHIFPGRYFVILFLKLPYPPTLPKMKHVTSLTLNMSHQPFYSVGLNYPEAPSPSSGPGQVCDSSQAAPGVELSACGGGQSCAFGPLVI